MNKQIIHYQVSRTFKSLKQNKNRTSHLSRTRLMQVEMREDKQNDLEHL